MLGAVVYSKTALATPLPVFLSLLPGTAFFFKHGHFLSARSSIKLVLLLFEVVNSFTFCERLGVNSNDTTN